MQRLIAIPDKAKSYTDELRNLEPEDIPWERIPEFKDVMHNSANEYDKVWAARILTEWGDSDGYDFLESYVCDREPSNEVLMEHRLRGYDDTNTQILGAAVKYWARRSDAGFEEQARKKIFKLVNHIIVLSNSMPFEIGGFFWLISDMGMTEYLPLLKEHLQAIIQRPEYHHWKVADCAHLLQKFDPEFVTQTLAAHGKTLADYPMQ